MVQRQSHSPDVEDSTPPRRRLRLPFVIHIDEWFPGSWRARSAFRLSVAALLGIAAGYGSILFRRLIDLVSGIAFPSGIGLAQLRQLPAWELVLVPAMGGLVVGPLVYFLAREARGHGVPEVKDACASKAGRIRPRVALVKTLASGVTIGTGGSVGREGPIVQIGSALGSLLGQALGLSGQFLIDMVAGGAAAGIAATFNAPIAGVLFALEVILERSSPRNFGPLIVSTVVATIVARHHLGDVLAFQVAPYTLVSAWELPLYVILGVLAAFVGVGFTKGLYALEDLWKLLPLPPYTHGVIGGAIVGAVAIWRPEVLGVGYEHIENVLGSGPETLPLTTLGGAAALLLLMAAKVFCTGTTIGSGASGGVFAPSLFLGASLGGAFGGMANRLMPPGLVAVPGAYALVAMGAVVAATTHAPLTAMLIVFELTDRHTIILPLMLSCILSAILAMRLCSGSIYTIKLLRRGAQAGSGNVAAAVVAQTKVRSLMDPAVAVVRPDTPILSVVERAVDLNQTHVYVTERKRKLLGAITMEDVAVHIRDAERTRRKLLARDLMHPAVKPVTPDDLLHLCVDRFSQREVDQLPVVDEEGRLRGRLTRGDLMSFVSREVLRRDAVFSFVREGQPDEPAGELVRLPTGEVKAMVPVEGGLADRTLRDLNLRVRYGINVYAVRHTDGHTTMPSPDEQLRHGETLLVVGPAAEVEHVQDRVRHPPPDDQTEDENG